MKSVTTERFRKSYAYLPESIKEAARKTYRLWQKDESHPSFHFKKIHNSKPVYSIRIGISYRAIGVKEKNTMIWFWIGTHSDYNRLISKL